MGKVVVDQSEGMPLVHLRLKQQICHLFRAWGRLQPQLMCVVLLSGKTGCNLPMIEKNSVFKLTSHPDEVNKKTEFYFFYFLRLLFFPALSCCSSSATLARRVAFSRESLEMISSVASASLAVVWSL